MSIVTFPAPDSIDVRFLAPASDPTSINGQPAHPTPDHIAAVDGQTMPRQAYALVMVAERFRMLRYQATRLTHLTQQFPLADAHAARILQQFAARLEAVHAALAVVVTPDMHTAIDAETARFEADMQRYDKRMRRQRPTAGEVRHG